MPFELLPILPTMAKIYEMPISRDRFEAYLFKLQGNTKDDMIMPIAGYNPMAKAHVAEKIQHLREMGAEQIIAEAAKEVNKRFATQDIPPIGVGLNLGDNVGGAWTNRFTTDFESKFRLNALVKRNFCTPYIWTSEAHNEVLIRQRSLEYMFRTVYWLENNPPVQLQDYVDMEVFVQSQLKEEVREYDQELFELVELYLKDHQKEEEYALIFNFFYGDQASESLGFPTFGMDGMTGFEYAVIKTSLSF
ncbi:MAG: hypothetical protein AAFY71_03775 [Bacteroidota bacterium]